MALKPTLATLDGLDESVSALYRASSEEEMSLVGASNPFHVLDVEATDGWKVANVTKLLNALEAERASTRKLEAFGELTPDSAKGLQVRIDELTEKLASKKHDGQDQVEELRSMAQSEMETAKSEWQKRIDSLNRTLDEEIVEKRALRELRENGFKESAEVMMPHVLPYLRRSEDENGNPTRDVRVVDSNSGNTRLASDLSNMTPAQLIQGLANDVKFARFADGSGSTGAGLNGEGTETAIAGGVLRIKSTDQAGINANIEAIGKGTVIVVD